MKLQQVENSGTLEALRERFISILYKSQFNRVVILITSKLQLYLHSKAHYSGVSPYQLSLMSLIRSASRSCRLWSQGFVLLTSVLLVFTSTQLSAGTIVRVNTSVGNFSIELFDDTAPATVQNFLNYVNRNAFNGNYIHRAETNFVVQTGGFSFQPFVGPIPVPADPPVVNEFGASNTRGTVAMAKIDGDPDSATSQWFVNLADNSATLDPQNGGFTVFGEVLGQGMLILDAINALPKINLGVRASNAPYITNTYTSPTEFVYINVELMQRFSAATHVFEDASGLLQTTVSINDGAEILSLNMNLHADTEATVLRVNPESVINVRAAPPAVASFNTSERVLRIPELEVNLDGSVSVVTNVVLRQDDVDALLFRLESFSE